MTKKVLVMMGGFSAERDVSLVSGKGVAEALRKKGYDVLEHDLKDVRVFLNVLSQEKPDVVFNALHGNWGEDGEIQGLLDLLQIPYTHSGLLASAVGMHKDITKKICEDIGIKVARGQKMRVADFFEKKNSIAFPFVVKPVCDGSSVGVYIIKKEDDLKNVLYPNPDTEVLVEDFIEGKELTCMCLDGKAYVVTEMRPKTQFYDYDAKYTDGMTEHVLPADIPEEAASLCKEYAEKLHKALGCNTVSRCDFRYNPKDGVVFLEINTHPGMTPLSLVPEQARFVGISYEDLCAKFVENATCRKLCG